MIFSLALLSLSVVAWATARGAPATPEEGTGTPDAMVGNSGSREPLTPDPAHPHRRQIIKATEDLASQLAVGVQQIRVLEVREITWPDASLGCPQPGIVYAKGPQAGLLIRLGVGRRMYFYHSGGTGDPFRCEQTSRVVPEAPPRPDEFVPPPDWEID